MMTFSTLWNLDRTIDPETGRSPVVDAIATVWDHDPGSVRFFRSSANHLYRLTRDGHPAFLRLAAGTERSATGIRQELALLAALTGAGVPVVQAIPARNGDELVTTGTPAGIFHAVVFDALPGVQRDLPDLDLAGMATWGATVGRLHAAMQTVPARCRGRQAGWEWALDWLESGTAPVPPVVLREADRLRSLLAALPRTPDQFGLIHTDLELDNLIWQGETVAVLDFDEYGEGWFLLDIAKALTDVLAEGESVESPRVRAFINGYRQFQPLADGDLVLLPGFLTLSELRGYCSLARAIDLAPEKAEVDWMRDLVVRLRAWMDAYEASLAG